MKIISEPTLDRFRSARKCELCRETVPRCDPNHVYSRGTGRLDIACNLSALCRVCHMRFHADLVSLELVKETVADREKTTVAAIKEVVWLLRRLPQEPSAEHVEIEIAELSADAQVIMRRVCLEHDIGGHPVPPSNLEIEF